MIEIGPTGLGSVKTAEEVLEKYSKLGFKTCEIAFTYSVYIKSKEDAIRIGNKAKELGIRLSIHAPYYINLNSEEKVKIESSKKRILDCCEIGELLGAKVVVFHAGYYGNDKEKCFENIKKSIIEIQKEIKRKKWKIKIAPETLGKINVFGSIFEISKLVEETGCGFCIDFAHILAREKRVDYELIKKAISDEMKSFGLSVKRTFEWALGSSSY
jgi:deoxyribonuclease-4